MRIGDYANFLKYSLEALYLKKELNNGNDHVDVANSLCNVSSAYREMKDYTNSLKFSLECLEMREKLLKSHPLTMITLHQVGVAYESIKDYKNAVLYLEKAQKMKMDLVKTNEKRNVEICLENHHMYIDEDLRKVKNKLSK